MSVFIINGLILLRVCTAENATDCLLLLFFSPRTVGAKDPNFGSVLHALKVSQKITRRRDQIRFNPSVCIPFPVFAIRRSEQLSPSTAVTSHMQAAS